MLNNSNIWNIMFLLLLYIACSMVKVLSEITYANRQTVVLFQTSQSSLYDYVGEYPHKREKRVIFIGFLMPRY